MLFQAEDVAQPVPPPVKGTQYYAASVRMRSCCILGISFEVSSLGSKREDYGPRVEVRVQEQEDPEFNFIMLYVT